MRLPNTAQTILPSTAHTSRPWRIHELTRDFRLEDVWELPARGGPDDFPRLVALIAAMDPSHSSSRAVRALFALRWKIGELLGWDGPDAGVGSRVPTLRDRLPADLRDAPSGPDSEALPFTPLYLIEDEWAAETANRTMHGVLHIGRVPDEAGGFRAQMAVLVKPNGRLGAAYMAAIRPFRHLIVYPLIMRDTARAWTGRRSGICLAPGEGTTRENPLGGPLTFKLRREQTGGAMTVFESTVAAGEGPPLHQHRDADEILYALEGNLRVKLGDTLAAAPAGSCVFIPRGVTHTFQNVGAAPARILVVFTPSSLEDFFDRFAALPDSEAGPDAFRRLGSESGMDVVGPPLAQSDPL